YAFPLQSQAFIFAFLRDFSAAFAGRILLTRRLACRCSVSVVAHYREFFGADKHKIQKTFCSLIFQTLRLLKARIAC
ncbi:hypothetical protein O7047_19985, partial [Pseudenterobacter timonensis]